jgi:hypothetical protein
MATEKKTNPALIACIIAFALGLAIAAWGWDKNESTIPERTHGAVAMIVSGCITAAVGLIGMAVIGGKTNRS